MYSFTYKENHCFANFCNVLELIHLSQGYLFDILSTNLKISLWTFTNIFVKLNTRDKFFSLNCEYGKRTRRQKENVPGGTKCTR